MPVATAATETVVAIVPGDKLFGSWPEVAADLWRDTLIDASIHREWNVNAGRRNARSRVVHLLCEIAHRETQAGIVQGGRYELPMTQEHLADGTGLTPVHVNRVIQQLRRNGLIAQDKRELVIEDREQMTAEADFGPDCMSDHAKMLMNDNVSSGQGLGNA